MISTTISFLFLQTLFSIRKKSKYPSKNKKKNEKWFLRFIKLQSVVKKIIVCYQRANIGMKIALTSSLSD